MPASKISHRPGWLPLSFFLVLIFGWMLAACSDTTVMTKKKSNDNNDFGETCVGSECDSLCADVQCNLGETCYRGVCHESCQNEDQCPGAQICEQGRCTAADCSLTPCNQGEVCFRGVCHESCTQSLDCPGTEICSEGRCIAEDDNPGPDPEDNSCNANKPCRDGKDCLNAQCVDMLCENVQCPAGETCSRGVCYATCNDTDDCNDGERCNNNRCTPFDCSQVTCRADETCSQGLCFPTCNNSSQCPAGTDCKNGQCIGDKCDGITCSADTNCYEGHCMDACQNDAQCNTGERCHLANRVCVPTDCSGNYCDAGAVCDNGVCYQGCLDHSDCGFGERCEQDKCVNPGCETTFCPQGEQCYRGECRTSGCHDDGDCSGDDQCHKESTLCMPKDCSKTQCLQDEVCNPDTGACETKCEKNADCPQGSSCNVSKGLCDDSCQQTTCRAGTACNNGNCYPTCDQTRECPSNSFCHHDGICLPLDCGNVSCSASRPVCEEGTCRLCKNVDRVSGWSQDPEHRRYYTAANFALNLYDDGADTAILALGRVSAFDISPDAISAGPLAYKLGAPILLTQFKSVPPITQSTLKRLGVKNIIIVGGTLAVSPDVENQLRQDGYSVTRYGGQEREDTAGLLAEALEPTTPYAFIVSADNQQLLSAITIGGVAATMRAPILLVHKDTVPPVTQRLLTQFNTTRTIVLGDSSIISDSVLAQLPNPERIDAPAGLKLSAAIAKFAIESGPNLTHVNVAGIDSMIDALVSGASGRILLLTPKNQLDPDAEDYLKEHAKNALLIGDENALSQKVEDDICNALNSPRQ